MQDQVLFWTIIAAIGQTLGALATAAAVIVSLWVVLSERKPKLRINAGLRLIIAGDGSPASDVIGITIANTGLRRVRCTSIGWRTGHLRRGPGWLRRQLALQNPDYVPGSATLPLDLEPGDDKTILLSVEGYVSATDPGQRTQLFTRSYPWSQRPHITRIDVVISLAAHNGIFRRVEEGLAHFLAFGAIKDGARRFNERADAQKAARIGC